MTSSELDTIAALEPSQRLARLVDYLERAEARTSQARALRDQTIRELRETGLSRPDVARQAGVSVAHVAAVTAKRD